MGRIRTGATLALAFALACVWAAPNSEATTFNPFFGPNFGPTEFYRLDPTTPGPASDVHAQFNISAPSSNHSPLFGNISFADSDMFIADAAGIPNTGAYVGSMSAVAQLGLANEGCNSQVPTTFNLVEASTDTTARSITNGGAMSLVGGSGAADTILIYAHPFDPMGVGPDGLPVNEIRVESEEMLITGVNTATNTYTVVRGWNGTTPAAHPAGAEIKRVNVIYPAGPAINLLVNLAQDDGDLDNNSVPEFALGSPGGPSFNGNYIADGSDAVPSFVRDMLDPNVNADDGGAISARARYMGVTFVAGTRVTLYHMVVAEPGSLAALRNLDWATPAWGYPMLAFLQDSLGPESNSAISDWCNFISNTTLFGVSHDNSCTGASPPVACTGTGGGFTLRLAVDGGGPTGGAGSCPSPGTTPNECGWVRQSNPASAQAVRFYQYAVSERDYDNDGYENVLDTCHSDPNPNWDPRKLNSLSGGDGDGDGLPAPCDPFPEESGAQCDNALDDDADGRVNDGCPATGANEVDAQCLNAVDDDSDGRVNDGCPASSFNNDQDGDGWQNRIDSCPLVADAAPGGGAGTAPNTFMWDQDVPAGQPVPDGGPHADGIAPACDIAGETCAGCPALTPTGANGHYHATAAAQTICIGTPTNKCSSSLDDDFDGVVNARDSCISGMNPPITFPDLAPPGGAEPGSAILTASANSGATQITVDNTSGFVDAQPIVIGSPLETVRYINPSGINEFGNTIQFSPPLSSAHPAGAPVAQVSFAQSLRDLNNDGFVDMIGDISVVGGAFGSRGGDPANDGVGDSGVPGYEGRFDLNYDSFIDVIGDISLLGGVFAASCGPP